MLAVAELVAGGRVDRQRPRPGGGVGAGAGVDLPGLEAPVGLLGIAHVRRPPRCREGPRRAGTPSLARAAGAVRAGSSLEHRRRSSGCRAASQVLVAASREPGPIVRGAGAGVTRGWSSAPARWPDGRSRPVRGPDGDQRVGVGPLVEVHQAQPGRGQHPVGGAHRGGHVAVGVGDRAEVEPGVAHPGDAGQRLGQLAALVVVVEVGQCPGVVQAVEQRRPGVGRRVLEGGLHARPQLGVVVQQRAQPLPPGECLVVHGHPVDASAGQAGTATAPVGAPASAAYRPPAATSSSCVPCSTTRRATGRRSSRRRARSTAGGRW